MQLVPVRPLVLCTVQPVLRQPHLLAIQELPYGLLHLHDFLRHRNIVPVATTCTCLTLAYQSRDAIYLLQQIRLHVNLAFDTSAGIRYGPPDRATYSTWHGHTLLALLITIRNILRNATLGGANSVLQREQMSDFRFRMLQPSSQVFKVFCM